MSGRELIRGEPETFWMDILYQIIETRLECTRSDAQSIADAQKALYCELYLNGDGAVSSADAVLEASGRAAKALRWCCTACGGQNVVCDAWVSKNDPDEVETFDEEFCHDCDASCHTEQRMVEPE